LDACSPKTPNAVRKVDLAPELAGMLKDYVGPLRGGFIFANGNGNPLFQTNVVRRKLHPILKDLGITKQGFHGTRRFRATHLRKQMAPEDLIQFWLGHAPSSITDRYSKLSEDTEFRQKVSEKVGLGFALSC
jgi:integrase